MISMSTIHAPSIEFASESPLHVWLRGTFYPVVVQFDDNRYWCGAIAPVTHGLEAHTAWVPLAHQIAAATQVHMPGSLKDYLLGVRIVEESTVGDSVLLCPLEADAAPHSGHWHGYIAIRRQGDIHTVEFTDSHGLVLAWSHIDSFGGASGPHLVRRAAEGEWGTRR